MRRGGWRREGVLDSEEVAVEEWKGVLGGEGLNLRFVAEFAR